MTECQEKIYNIIKEYINENGYSPTIREIGKIAMLNSSCTVFKHLKNLEKKGFISMEKSKPRTIRILK
jgi:repressor LexA